MTHIYKTKGTCATEIHFEVADDIIESVSFVGGCTGNASALSILVKGMRMDDIIEKFKGLPCDDMLSSCPDQLACALLEYKENRPAD